MQLVDKPDRTVQFFAANLLYTKVMFRDCAVNRAAAAESHPSC
jgi:hypothetical protein